MAAVMASPELLHEKWYTFGRSLLLICFKSTF